METRVQPNEHPRTDPGAELSTSTNPLPAAARGAGRVRRLWGRRALEWDQHGSAGLERVVDALVATARPLQGRKVIDLGCGNGQLSLPLARLGATVVAVDVSSRMIETLAEKAAAEGLDIETVVCPIQELRTEPASVDRVVSNYVMHHLYDDEKRTVLAAAVASVRPGGHVTVGDMMFGRGTTKDDREIIASKVDVMLRRGPAGWWRIVKNAARFTLRVRERPLPMDAWMQMFREAGLVDVHGRRVVAEAAIVVGTKPGPSTSSIG